MGDGTCGQMGVIVNTEDRDGVPWRMGHMGKGILWLILNIEMGYLGGWGTWVMGHMGNWAHLTSF